MSALPSREPAPRDIAEVRAVPIHLPAGRIAVHDLRAGTSIVALEGALQLHFRDHSLAWLGEAVPATAINLHEGECFVMPQRGAVSIGAVHAQAAAFVLQSAHTENRLLGSLRGVAQSLIGFVRNLLRERAA
nr:hypothetical protein HUO10_000493 [Paraburkholderia busanensis]